MLHVSNSLKITEFKCIPELQGVLSLLCLILTYHCLLTCGEGWWQWMEGSENQSRNLKGMHQNLNIVVESAD